MSRLLNGIADTLRRLSGGRTRAPQGTASLGTASRGTASRGTASRGTASRGTASRGTASDTTSPSGSATDGAGSRGEGSHGTTHQPSRHVPTARRGRHLEYSPNLDGDADPGEVVWTWVKYEDDPTQGKDRPVLVVGRDGRTLLGLMLSSQSERDGQPNWLALGPGAWDRESRPSWIRLDRILEVDEDGIRREGAVLDRSRFDQVADALRRDYGWA